MNNKISIISYLPIVEETMGSHYKAANYKNVKNTHDVSQIPNTIKENIPTACVVAEVVES